jgi:uncharacterized membrane protein YhaH (DUF805 family)
MSETVALIWGFALFGALINGCGAGMAATLHARGRLRRGGKVWGACIVTGLITAGIFAPFAFTDAQLADDDPVTLVLVLVVIFVIAMIVALPGALMITRRLQAPGDDYRTFE